MIQRCLPIFALVAAGCTSGPPIATGPVEPTVVIALPPAPISSPSPTPDPPPSASNTPPRATGPTVCISPVGDDHVFDLRVTDREDDRFSWRAETIRPQGTLAPGGGRDLEAGTTIRLVYAPPPGVPDNNRIVLTLTDARGASATVTLVVENH